MKISKLIEKLQAKDPNDPVAAHLWFKEDFTGAYPNHDPASAEEVLGRMGDTIDSERGLTWDSMAFAVQDMEHNNQLEAL